MKSIYNIALLVTLSALVTSCHDTKNPNYQYMPNMYESVAYETYAESNAFKNGKEGQLPAEGSIKRGFETYEYENSTAGYDLAKANLKSPLDTLSTKDADTAKEFIVLFVMVIKETVKENW